MEMWYDFRIQVPFVLTDLTVNLADETSPEGTFYLNDYETQYAKNGLSDQSSSLIEIPFILHIFRLKNPFAKGDDKRKAVIWETRTVEHRLCSTMNGREGLGVHLRSNICFVATLVQLRKMYPGGTTQ